MCGIVAAIARRDVVPLLLDGLKRLEYRGYDSAGLAVVNGRLQRLRSTGRVAALAELTRRRRLSGNIGIAHTRWATHGAPSERNAHPHVSGGVSVVHNGIIENYHALRGMLEERGYVFTSDTDTEAVAHLVHFHLGRGAALIDAVRACTAQLTGAYAIAVATEDDPARFVVARTGAPLLLGMGEGENYAASDVAALVDLTRRVVHLEEGDCAEITLGGARIFDSRGRRLQRPVERTHVTSASMELGPYRHYMQKEIFEQPAALASTLEMVMNARPVSPRIFGARAESILGETDAVVIVACGTSYHAGLVARHWLEELAGIPCNVEIASEFRYRKPVPNPRALVIAISQSGETADTLAAVQHARELGHRYCLALCNVPESALVRMADLRYLTRAGPEIGVASTKAFTTQLAVLLLFSMTLAKVRGQLEPAQESSLLQSLRQLPGAVARTLQTEAEIRTWAENFARRQHALFLGRGIHYPIAMEGALKLKEISYIHAEAYAAGELKHGPLALVDSEMPVIAIAPQDVLLEKLQSNLEEVRARGGQLYVVADRDTRLGDEHGAHVIRLPDPGDALSPILHAIPLQLLAYWTALERGTDIDKPRNLAKSVTVE